MSSSARPSTGPGWSPSLVLSTIVMVMILEATALGYTIVTTALPAITTDFRTTQGGWLLSAFILAGAVVSPLAGKLADVYGKRRIMLCMLGLGLIGAVVATAAPTFEVLVIGRALQGTVIATMFLTYSLMRDVYPPRVLPLAASISTTGVGIFSIGMPFLVGWLLDTWGWRGLFAFDIVWILVLGPLLVLTTAESPVRVRSRVDYLGAALLGGGIAAVLSAVSFARTLPTTTTVVLAVVGIVLLALFVQVSLRRREPIVDLRVFTRRGILLAAVTAAAAYGATAVFASISPLIALTPRVAGTDYGLGLTAFGYSAISAPQALLIVVSGVVVGLVIGRTGGQRLMVLGLLLLAAGGLLAALRHDTLAQMVAAALLVGLGTGFCYGSIPNLVVAATPADQQGSIASMVQVFQGSLASAAPVVLFAILAAAARPTPGGAYVYSSAAMQNGLYFMVGIAVVGAVLAMTVLRPRRSTSVEPVAEPAPAT